MSPLVLCGVVVYDGVGCDGGVNREGNAYLKIKKVYCNIHE